MSRRHATTRKILSEYAETTNRPESSFCNRSKDREGQFWHGNYNEMRFSAQHICSYSEIWVRKEGLGHGREDVKYSPWSQRSEFKRVEQSGSAGLGFVATELKKASTVWFLSLDLKLCEYWKHKDIKKFERERWLTWSMYLRVSRGRGRVEVQNPQC